MVRKSTGNRSRNHGGIAASWPCSVAHVQPAFLSILPRDGATHDELDLPTPIIYQKASHTHVCPEASLIWAII